MLALQRGILIPTFRSDVQGLFGENLTEIKDQGIQGVLPEANVIAATLEEAVQRSTRYSHRVWPSTPLSEGFAEVIDRSLYSESLSAPTAGFEQVWSSTAKLRESAIADARGRSSEGGLRRGELYNAVARCSGLTVDKVDDIRLVIEQIENPVERQTVERFLKWVNYCYHYNQGRMFGLNPALVDMDAVDIEFSGRLKDVSHGGNSAEILCTTVLIPSVGQLLTVDAKMLLEVRDSEAAGTYFTKQAAWQEGPSEKTAEELLDALTAYADEITSTYVRHGRNIVSPRQLLRAALPTERVRTDFLLNRFISLAETVITPVGVLGFIADTIAGGYCFMPERVRSFLKWALRIKEAVRFDVEPDRRLV